MPDLIAHLSRLSLQGYTIVTPNTRLANFLSERLAQFQRSAIDENDSLIWQSADIRSYERLIQDSFRQKVFEGALQARKILDPACEQWLWEQAIKRTESSADTDISNPANDLNLLSSRGAANEASRAYALLLNWLVDIDEHRFTLESHIDSRSLLTWVREFEALAVDKNLINLVQMQRALIDLDEEANESNQFVAVGFQMMSPLQEKCFHHLSAGCWKNLDSDLVKPEYLQKESPAARPCNLYLARSAEDEWRIAARWMWFNSMEANGERNAVVIPSLTQNRLAIERVFDEVAIEAGFTPQDYNISAGTALSRVPLIQHWLWLIRSLCGSLARDQVLQLVWSPFLFAEKHYPSRHCLSRALFDAGESEYSITEWSALLSWSGFATNRANNVNQNLVSAEEGDELKSQDEFNALLLNANAIARKVRGREQQTKGFLSGWIARFREFENLFGFSKHRSLSSDEYQQWEMFELSLEHLCQQDDIYGQLSAAAALRTIEQYLQSRIYQAQTIRRDTMVMPEVLGVLEAAGQQFDRIWLCEMSDLEWPPRIKTSGLLPYGFQLAQEMPGSPAREQAYAKVQTAQLCQSAAVVNVSYRREIDEVDSRLSPYVRQSFSQFAAYSDSFETHNQHTGQPGVKAIIEQVEDGTGISLEEISTSNSGVFKKIRGGVAALSDQAQLPLLGYLRHRLAIQPLPAFQSGLSPSERGICLHRVLELFWSRYKSQAHLLAAEDYELRTTLETMIEDALQQVSQRRFKSLYPAEMMVEKQSLLLALDAWLKIESDRNSFQVVQRELPFAYQYQGFSLEGRIDRVDNVDGLGQLVIDYKSGATSTTGWFNEELSSPQLPLYAIALANFKNQQASSGVAGIAYANLRFGEIGLQGCVSDHEANGKNTERQSLDKGLTVLSKNRYTDLAGWSELMDQWREAIDLHMQALISGDASIDVTVDAQDSIYQPLLRSGFYQDGSVPEEKKLGD